MVVLTIRQITENRISIAQIKGPGSIWEGSHESEMESMPATDASAPRFILPVQLRQPGRKDERVFRGNWAVTLR